MFGLKKVKKLCWRGFLTALAGCIGKGLLWAKLNDVKSIKSNNSRWLFNPLTSLKFVSVPPWSPPTKPPPSSPRFRPWRTFSAALTTAGAVRSGRHHPVAGGPELGSQPLVTAPLFFFLSLLLPTLNHWIWLVYAWICNVYFGKIRSCCVKNFTHFVWWISNC